LQTKKPLSPSGFFNAQTWMLIDRSASKVSSNHTSKYRHTQPVVDAKSLEAAFACSVFDQAVVPHHLP
jgi:hypothetical protein